MKNMKNASSNGLEDHNEDSKLRATTIGASENNFAMEAKDLSTRLHQLRNQRVRHYEPDSHDTLLNRILNKISVIDFQSKTGVEEGKLSRKHFLICVVEEIIALAKNNNWGLCRNQEFIYIYNSAYWRLFDNAEFESFLGNAAERMGVKKFDARFYSFRGQLLKQFLATANLPKPKTADDMVLINLKNGTFEISTTHQNLRTPLPEDFMTHQLQFEYNPDAQCPLFLKYLNRVLPDKECQNVIAEYFGYVFIRPKVLKLEKTLLLYGGGANGKSVLFDIANAVFGAENTSSFSLQSLTNENGYYRAQIANKLVNYASEINSTLESDTFKKLVSGEPVDARLPYGDPFHIINYAKLIFNCNQLPKDVEHTHAYFRRFLIVPFDVTIPDEEQDKHLAQKIISAELSGVFNWILEGLNRLLEQKNFTDSSAVRAQLETYKKESDSICMFLSEEIYEKSITVSISLKTLYRDYQNYCKDNNYQSIGMRVFSERLRKLGYIIERKNYGRIVFMERKESV